MERNATIVAKESLAFVGGILGQFAEMKDTELAIPFLGGKELREDVRRGKGEED